MIPPSRVYEWMKPCRREKCSEVVLINVHSVPAQAVGILGGEHVHFFIRPRAVVDYLHGVTFSRSTSSANGRDWKRSQHDELLAVGFEGVQGAFDLGVFDVAFKIDEEHVLALAALAFGGK